MTQSRLSVSAMAEVGSSLLSPIDHLILTSAAASPAIQTLGAPRVVVHATGYTLFLSFPTIDRDAMAPWIAQGISAVLLALLLESCASGCTVLNIDAHAPTLNENDLLDAHLKTLIDLGAFSQAPKVAPLSVTHRVLATGHYIVIKDSGSDMNLRTQHGTAEELEAHVATERAEIARKIIRHGRILAAALILKDEAARKNAA